LKLGPIGLLILEVGTDRLLILEVGTDRLFRRVGKKLPLLAA